MLCSSDSIQSLGRYPANDATYGLIWKKQKATRLNYDLSLDIHSSIKTTIFTYKYTLYFVDLQNNSL